MAATQAKDDMVHLEKAANEDPAHFDKRSDVEEDIDDDPVYSYKEQRAIIHRIDRRLITIAGIIYMNSLMDRSNLPNAMIAGMGQDLGMNLNGYVRNFSTLAYASKADMPSRVLLLSCSSSRTPSFNRQRPSSHVRSDLESFFRVFALPGAW